MSSVSKAFKKVKEKSVNYWKKKAWQSFSIYIRTKYADHQGFASCYTCGARKHWKELQAGHGTDGRGNSVLFWEKIVRPQCAPCNIWKRGNYTEFHARLVKEYGPKILPEIIKRKKQTKQFTIEELKGLIKKYNDVICPSNYS